MTCLDIHSQQPGLKCVHGNRTGVNKYLGTRCTSKTDLTGEAGCNADNRSLRKSSWELQQVVSWRLPGRQNPLAQLAPICYDPLWRERLWLLAQMYSHLLLTLYLPLLTFCYAEKGSFPDNERYESCLKYLPYTGSFPEFTPRKNEKRIVLTKPIITPQ